MTAKIIDLAEWQSAHPPLVRLAHISGHLMLASIAYQRNYWRAWLSMFVVRR